MNSVSYPQHVLITGGAGYIGSLLAGELLRQDYKVTVVDDLLFGGESLLAYFPNPDFHFVKSNVCDFAGNPLSLALGMAPPAGDRSPGRDRWFSGLPGGGAPGCLALQRRSNPGRF